MEWKTNKWLRLKDFATNRFLITKLGVMKTIKKFFFCLFYSAFVLCKQRWLNRKEPFSVSWRRLIWKIATMHNLVPRVQQIKIRSALNLMPNCLKMNNLGCPLNLSRAESVPCRNWNTFVWITTFVGRSTYFRVSNCYETTWLSFLFWFIAS